MRMAPDFKLFDQDDVLKSLDDYKGDWLVLFFYPLDGSVICSREACAFRDVQALIAEFGNA